jgi:protein TonB
MFTRILSSAIAGFTITAGLLYLMHYLIDVSEGAIDPRPTIRLAPWVKTIEDTEVAVRDLRAERIRPPEVVPQFSEKTGSDEPVTGVRVRPTVANPIAEWLKPSLIGYTDGALITIIAVRPNYPAAASRRGIEGHVLVQFDVSEMETVTNAVVVESSNRLFDRSAIEAAKKFRFKPRVIDGVPHMSFNVRRLFTFEMEKN